MAKQEKNKVLIGVAVVLFLAAGVLIFRSLFSSGPAPQVSEDAAAGAAAAAEATKADEGVIEPKVVAPRGSGRVGR